MREADKIWNGMGQNEAQDIGAGTGSKHKMMWKDAGWRVGWARDT